MDEKYYTQLLERVGCKPKLIRHCKIVSKLAVRIAKLCSADVELVKAGALLHDIGRCKTHGIRHGVEGAKLAKELNLEPRLISIIERHIGAGIPKAEAKKIGLPPKDYLPTTLEEKIIAHADNLISAFEKQPVRRAIESERRKGHYLSAEKIAELHKELSEICKIDLDKIKL